MDGLSMLEKTFSSYETIIISGYDEFDYVNGQFPWILRNIS